MSLIENIKNEVPISKVIEDEIAVYKRGNRTLAYCPFHNDNNLGSFHITDSKGIFKCFACDEGGDHISFIEKYKKMTTKEAVRYLAKKYNVKSDYKGKVSNKRFTKEEKDLYKRKKRNARNNMKIYERELRHHQSNIAYQEVLDFLKLRKKEYDYLKSRGLTDELIQEKGYRTPFIDNRTYKQRKKKPNRSPHFLAFMKKLYDEKGIHYIKAYFHRLAGFYTFGNGSKIGTRLTMHEKNSQLVIPIRDGYERITGIQIRNNNDSDLRYYWLSTPEGTYENGGSVGSPLDVHYPKELKNETILITEGHFKALQLAEQTGCIAISVQGVGNWNEISYELSKIEKHIPQKYGFNFYIKKIGIMYDADMVHNSGVQNQIFQLGDYLLNHHQVYIGIWREEYGKGIDDVLLSGHSNQIQMISFKTWWSRFCPTLKSAYLRNKTKPFENFQSKELSF